MKRILTTLSALLLALAAWSQAQEMQETHEKTGFVVRIENVSSGETLQTMSGGLPAPLAPGVWVLHGNAAPLFRGGEADRGDGLEALAEDGNPVPLAEYLAGAMMAGDFGVFNTPAGTEGPGPLLPGGVYEFAFEASPGAFLSFATMFVHSNDLFYAPDEAGIALFDAMGEPVSGDVTSQILLWDAGTEVDEPAGEGPHQAPRQAGPDTGEDENGAVTLVLADDRPDLAGPVIRVTITPSSGM